MSANLTRVLATIGYSSLSDPVLPGSPGIALSRIVHYQVYACACICMDGSLHLFRREYDPVYSIVPSVRSHDLTGLAVLSLREDAPHTEIPRCVEDHSGLNCMHTFDT